MSFRAKISRGALGLDEFLEDIPHIRSPNPGLEEAKRTLEVVERIYRKSGYLSTH